MSHNQLTGALLFLAILWAMLSSAYQLYLAESHHANARLCAAYVTQAELAAQRQGQVLDLCTDVLGRAVECLELQRAPIGQAAQAIGGE